MKLIKMASGKRKIKISKKEWQNIGKTAGWLRHVRCSECGDLIKFYFQDKEEDSIICDRCKHPMSPSVGSGGSGKYNVEDDMSGGSSSWDNVVRLYEGN